MKKFTASLNPDLKAFERDLTAFLAQEARTIDDSIMVIDLLNKDCELGASEVARRVRLVIGQNLLSASDAEKLLAAASRWQPIVKQSIQHALSAEQRQRIYSSKSSPILSRQTALTGPTSPDILGSPAPADLVAAEVNDSARKTENDEDFRSVLLLGSSEAHESNIRLLKARDFSPIRVSSLLELDSLLDEMICGIIVDGSWWTSVPGDKHAPCLRDLLSFSNFIWLKIDGTSLNEEVAMSFQTLCKECRFRVPLWNEVGFPRADKVGDQDIQHLNAAADHLTAAGRIKFHPSEITEGEATVLLGAIEKRQAGKPGLTPLEIQRVDTSIVHGGLSSAKIVILKPNDISSPFVAKIAVHKHLEDEMLRFSTFIEPWQGQLLPELFVHHGVAVMFFALIDGAADPSKAAPTLEERVIALTNRERNENSRDPANIDDLQIAVTKAVEKLTALNRKVCLPCPIGNSCWVTVEPLIEFKKNNVEHAIYENGSLIDILALAESARVQVQRLNGKAICHGDVHLRNILVRLDREPIFIDFANSGPGHPVFDLVRLEASLLYAHFRMVQTEDEIAEFFRAFFSRAWTIEDLRKIYPSFFASKASYLSIHASIETRRAALSLLQAYGGNEKDYFSMKVIVACQTLTIAGFQQGVVRASIRALAHILSVP